MSARGPEAAFLTIGWTNVRSASAGILGLMTAIHDGGVLGADAVSRSVGGHPAALTGGLRALIIQSLHPLAMAGVAQHSDYRNRALDRLRRTAYYVSATTFGDLETAQGAARRVKSMHRKVKGIDPVT